MHSLAFPPKNNSNDPLKVIQFNNLVVVGSNGSGKTRFGSFVEEKEFHRVIRISAQKSLTLPPSIPVTSMEEAELRLRFGLYSQQWGSNTTNYFKSWKSHIYNDKPSTHMVNDYDKLLNRLLSEEHETNLRYKQGEISSFETQLDRVVKIWERVFPQRKLKVGAGKIEVYDPAAPERVYNAADMSDGERVLFYIAGKVICAPENFIILIDEPSNHLHPAIINEFYDVLELARADCAFVYLTHNIDFAFSRSNTLKVWSKGYRYGVWDYEILDGSSEVPERMYLEILGSRKPVLFIEGDTGSIDYLVYQQLFSDFTIKPVGSCNKVIHCTKSMNLQGDFHRIQAYGLVDRDTRTEEEVNSLNEQNVWVLNVAEVENLLLVKPIIKAACNHLGRKFEDVLPQVSENLFQFFEAQKSEQIKLLLARQLRFKLESIANLSSVELEDVAASIEENFKSINVKEMEDEITSSLNLTFEARNYDMMLGRFSPKKKSLIPNSDICALLGLKKPTDYIDLVNFLFKLDRQNSLELITEVKKYVVGSL